MSKTITHWLNLALNRWNNSRPTAKNINRPNKIHIFGNLFSMRFYSALKQNSMEQLEELIRFIDQPSEFQ